MHTHLLPVEEQVVVVTGASSGIGLATARKAARRGARVVLAARNEGDLRRAVEDIRHRGGRAVHVSADVSSLEDVERIAEAAVREFGRIDTWVNDAAVAVYGRIVDVPVEDMRRQMDVNYWGQVYGCLTAVRHMRARGGALINVGSALSDRAIPLQGTYCAAKHALKAFTDTLRMELAADGVPISVTLIKPASIDTPFFDKAKTYLGREPQPIPPVYSPRLVADVILEAAQRPIREIGVGGAAAGLSASRLAPGLTDRYMEWSMFDQQKTDTPATVDRPHNLHRPVADDGGERGTNWTGHMRRSSVYTSAVLHPLAATAIVGSVLAAMRIASARRERAA